VAVVTEGGGMTDREMERELWPSEQRVAEIIANVYRETGYGPDREELRDILGARSTKSIPGVRGAQKAGLIRYDENERLVPA
jgi:SOS-response transcriptional repressor LexA